MSELAVLVDRIRSTFGLQVRAEQKAVVDKAVRRISAELRISSHDLFRRLLTDTKLLHSVAADLTVGETFFFRQEAHFIFIVNLLKQHQAGFVGRPFRVLSAGCGNGAEPYSLVMAINEAGLRLHEVEIDACDVNPLAIAEARGGVYTDWAFRQLSEKRRKRYFRKQQDRCWQIISKVRSKVRFRHQAAQELLQKCAPESFDAILCRNMTVYFHPEAANTLYASIGRALRPNGRLLIASTDPRPLPSSLARTTDIDPNIYGVPIENARYRFSQKPPHTCAAVAQPEIGHGLQRLSKPIETETAIEIDMIRNLANQGEIEQAIRRLNQLSHIRPDDAGLHLLRGQIYLSKDCFKEAIEAIERGLKIDSSDLLARYWHVIALREAEQYQRALGEAVELRAALSLLPPQTRLSDDQTTSVELKLAVQQLQEEIR